MRSLLVLVLLGLPQMAVGQRSSAARGSGDVVGTYRHFTASRSGCAIEVGERRGDSVRVQFACNRGAPSYHLGGDDVQVHLRHGVAVYERNDSAERCTIRFEFGRARVRLTQVGSDIACGFGAGVNVDGTYPRVSRRQPKFDLWPV